MATSMVQIPKNTWTLVSETSIAFQIPGQRSAYAVEALSLPAANDLSIIKRISPGRDYSFEKLDGNLYIYSKGANIQVATEPLQ